MMLICNGGGNYFFMEDGEISDNDSHSIQNDSAPNDNPLATQYSDTQINLHSMDWNDDELITAWDDAMDSYNNKQKLKNTYRDIQSNKKKRASRHNSEPNKPETITNNENIINEQFLHQQPIHNQTNFKTPPSITLQQQHQKIPDSHLTSFPFSTAVKPPNPPTQPFENPDQAGLSSDEIISNMMMSWYWAGYYTGLHAASSKQ